MIYTTSEAGAILDLAPVSIRQYCHRYQIGTRRGRDWFLEDSDLDVIRVRMRDHPEFGNENSARHI